MTEPFPILQARALKAASVPYADWIRALCDRCGIAWREAYATPIDDPARDAGKRREGRA